MWRFIPAVAMFVTLVCLKESAPAPRAASAASYAVAPQSRSASLGDYDAAERYNAWEMTRDAVNFDAR
jgi:hypothetical protein